MSTELDLAARPVSILTCHTIFSHSLSLLSPVLLYLTYPLPTLPPQPPLPTRLTLKAQLAKSNPQSVHQHYEETLQGVREKTGFASQQLMATAQKADQSIRYDSC